MKASTEGETERKETGEERAEGAWAGQRERERERENRMEGRTDRFNALSVFPPPPPPSSPLLRPSARAYVTLARFQFQAACVRSRVAQRPTDRPTLAGGVVWDSVSS